MNTVAFFCDKNIIPGFHAALSSLLINNFSTTPLKIFVFSDGLSGTEQQLILKTFRNLKKENHFLEIRKAPYMRIAGANSLGGNFTAYGRLFLGELLQETNLVLYLDSDLIINMDINNVFDEMVGDYTLFVSGVGDRNWSLDKKLFKAANLEMDGFCFNSGILGINLSKWRTLQAFSKCLEIINQYPNQFLSADQAVLNVAFHDDFKVLTKNINISAMAPYPVKFQNGIYHFIGLPKPWHPFMKRYHTNYFIWEQFIKQSALSFNSLRYFNLLNFIRIINSYKRIILTKNK